MKIACCDDKTEITEYLKNALNKICKSADVNADIILFNSGEALISYCIKTSIDVLFLDIDLGTSNGISIAKVLNTFAPNLQIIYVTAYRKYVDKICFSNFENIIIKPISEEKLRFVLFQAIGNVSSTKSPSLILKQQSGNIVIDTNDIVFIESEKRKVYFHLKNGDTETTYSKLSDVFDNLPNNFMFCHRCFVVNMDEIKQLHSSHLNLKNGKVLPIPIKRYNEILNNYIQYRRMEIE